MARRSEVNFEEFYLLVSKIIQRKKAQIATEAEKK